MRYDDAAVERALAALSLEDTPPDLHARIMLAVGAPMQPAFRTWELWVLGAAFAICAWIVMVVAGVPFAGEHAVVQTIAAWSQHVPQLIVGALTPSVTWLAVGVAATYLTLLVYRPFERVPLHRR
jgi:hypothetical protein